MITYALLQLHLWYFGAGAVSCQLTGSGNHTFFGLPYWWQYMKGVSDGAGGCVPDFSFPASIFPIGLAIVNILLHIAGFAAVVGIIVSGVNYMIAIGNPEKITSSRKGIQNSLIGLAIALIAAQVVTYIGEKIS